MTYKQLIKRITKIEPTTFIRIGDGEVNAIFKKQGANCDNHIYYPEMGEAIKNVLTSKPDYFIGMQNLAMKIRGNEIKAFKKDNNLKNLKWFNADILHHASIKGNIKPFFEALNTRKNIVLVGPAYLSIINKYINYSYHIQIPEVNCWTEYKQISYNCSKIANRLIVKKEENILFLVCGSMMAKVLINGLYDQYNHKTNISLLDIGSLFDPFCGRKTRSYHKGVDLVQVNKL